MTARWPKLDVVGYTDQLSVLQGGTIGVHVSSTQPQYTARLVRLIHGDTSEKGPGFKQELVPSDIDGEYAGTHHRIHTGSWAHFGGLERLGSPTRLELRFAFMPTAVAGPKQVLCHLTFQEGRAVTLLVQAGRLLVDDGADAKDVGELLNDHWFDLTLRVHRGQLELQLVPEHWADLPKLHVSFPDSGAKQQPPSALFLASKPEWQGERPLPQQCFNGRISDLHLQADEHTLRWDFAQATDTDLLPECSELALHGRAYNLPTRLVTGAQHDGQTVAPAQNPAHYNAIHFHDDDLGDAAWPVAFHFQVPDDLPSGVYAFWLQTAEGEDHVPFCVTPGPNAKRARVALLMPTVSALVYANSSFKVDGLLGHLMPQRDSSVSPHEYAYIAQERLLSLYDTHSDGSGVVLAAVRRPQLLAFRPKSRWRSRGAPHQLGADLYLVDWLTHVGIPFDVITDAELHREGVAALRPYAAVVTGSHAEYWTGDMLGGLLDYERGGGNVIYLSGNGLYWVTGVNADFSAVEVRRPSGTRAYTTRPGEAHLCTTGELGGLWRERGHPPQRYVGVGMTAQGFDRGCGYKRLPISHEPEYNFIFNGVSGDKIGDFPALSLTWGAAGYEIDRADHSLGTPRQAVILASANEFSDAYQLAIEDCVAMTPFYGGSQNKDVRADMVYYRVPGGGQVFSVGSINWTSCLSYNNYDNDVARVTENVLRAFAG